MAAVVVLIQRRENGTENRILRQKIKFDQIILLMKFNLEFEPGAGAG
jgi:hypothetical protein